MVVAKADDFEHERLLAVAAPQLADVSHPRGRAQRFDEQPDRAHDAARHRERVGARNALRVRG